MKNAGVVIILFWLAACSSNPVQQDDGAPATKEESFQTLVADLKSPWDIEYDQETFYISEREGTITSWTEGEEPVRNPVQTKKEIIQQGEGGLLGFKLLPGFEDHRRALAYHTYEEEGSIMNRIIEIERNSNQWKETSVLLEDIPGAQFHNGGRIEIGPDDQIYVTTGDSLNESLAQDRESLAGKILRLSTDGTAAEGNPFDSSYVYSYGHRNPQGLTWNEEGELYATEHGPDNHDEVNLIQPGQNYGWPEIVGDEERDGMITPLYETGRNTWAPSGVVFYREELIIASLRGEAVMNLPPSGGDPEVLTEQYGRIRDVEVVDDRLYFITNNTDGRGSPGSEDDQLVRYSP
ncbi:Glucose/arabinose dehydrogenase, beta-propeller fold [Halobacillus alkaliphilus]|uniref:Glucose/arabinose dehydrogenase, beta-propeller fold n=1 Tax=Halobacillus alkaliphilus TaxID=396056 RepID=A0A1I2LXV1_9BACI|nr:PQQ-dependent sugar dehydrogenase [Halobacillus alkaliphilus]SFF81956.1 Glucose/arabinose dehydrogenase, beta-propeller fold [Halobacillus alkaliphilus]